MGEETLMGSGVRRTPTRPWEIRNAAAAKRWVERGRTHTIYELWHRNGDSVVFNSAWRRIVTEGVAVFNVGIPPHEPMPPDLRSTYDGLMDGAMRLMGPGKFLPVIHVGDDV